MSRKQSAFLNSLIISALLLLASGSAFAQATRTWVSGVGDDANPCSRTAPCKTWAGAISKTAAGGIINCIDPGGFGTVTATKSITISCKHVEGSSLASATTGVVVNGANIDVVLRGLDIDGGSPTSTGLYGVRFVQGSSLIVDDCVIRDFNGAAPNGSGIAVLNSTQTAEIHVINSTITGNGNASSGAGINIAPTGTGGARVYVTNSTLLNNTIGLRASTAGTTGAIGITVTDTSATGSPLHGIVAEGTSGAVRMMLNGVTSANNLGDGVQATGGNSIVRIGSSTVTGNAGTGLIASGGAQLFTYGNNQVNGNTTDGSGSAVALR